MAENLDNLVEQLSNLTVLEAAELSKKLEEKWGVSAAAPAAVAAPAAGGGEQAEPEEEQTEFDVVLNSPGSNKINVIKEIRGITGLGLKEAKEVVENTPKTLKEGVAKEDAQSMKEKLENAGATIEVK